LTLTLSEVEAFISGNDTICDNGDAADIKVDFIGIPPFTFVYAINGDNAPLVITQNNPYFFSTKQAGVYVLEQFNDATGTGTTSGSALVTILESPTAIITLISDTLSTIYPWANFASSSIGNVISWNWDFGDNTSNSIEQNPTHQYKDSISIYQASLIITDLNGCSDTVSKFVFVINSEQDESYWMWLPNSFTPDYDNLNDKFCLEYNRIKENTFVFKVFNSQGELMYQSIDPSEMRCSTFKGWDGKHYLTNIELPSDTYIYDIYYEEEKGWKHQDYGTIILVR
jgi:gliding motility-associated-like protein